MMSSQAVFRLSRQNSINDCGNKKPNGNNNNDCTTKTKNIITTPTKTRTTTKSTTTAIKLSFDAMQQKQQQQQQALSATPSQSQHLHLHQQQQQQQPQQQQQQLTGGNIILLRGARNENGQIIIQNKHDIINFINEQQQKQQLATITTSAAGSLNQLPATTTVARKLVHTSTGGTVNDVVGSKANITVVAKDMSNTVCGTGGVGNAITTTNTILLQTPINASQLESVLLQTQGQLKKSTIATQSPITVASTVTAATTTTTNEQQTQQRPFLLRNASRSLSTDGNTLSLNSTNINTNNNKGPFVLQTLKRLEKSQSILVIRNTAASSTTSGLSATTLSSSVNNLNTGGTTSNATTPSIVFQSNERKTTTTATATTFARVVKTAQQLQKQHHQQQQQQQPITHKLNNRPQSVSTSTQSLNAASSVINKQQQQTSTTTKAYLRFNSGTNNLKTTTTATTAPTTTVFTHNTNNNNNKQIKINNNKQQNSQFASVANNHLASGNNNRNGNTPNGVNINITETIQLTETEQISTLGNVSSPLQQHLHNQPTARQQQQQQQQARQPTNVPLGSDGEPIKLPDNLESLPRADSFPSQRHRWNTNEEIAAILISFDKHAEWQSKEVKTRPKSGSLLLYSRKKVRYRRDGYCWKKRKDGKTTREDHMKLKVQGTECIYGCYVHSAILPTFHRRCYWLLQNPDIVLVHYLNVPYPDDNKMAVIAPSITLWGDKKEWTKEELVSQLKPMLSTVTSDDDSDSGNDIEISTAETVESIVCQLMEKQRLSRQAALIKQLDCGCGDAACADGKTCTHPVLRRPSLMKSTATATVERQRYASLQDGNHQHQQQQQQQQLAATHATGTAGSGGNTPNVVVGSKLYTRWSERRMRDSTIDNHHYQQQQHQPQHFQVIPATQQQQQQHSEHVTYQQQQQRQQIHNNHGQSHQMLTARSNLVIQQQQQQQRYVLTNQHSNNNNNPNNNKNNSQLNNALQQKVNIKSTNININPQHSSSGEAGLMLTSNSGELISNQHHPHHHLQFHPQQQHQQQQHHHQQQNHMSTNSISDNKINRNQHTSNNSSISATPSNITDTTTNTDVDTGNINAHHLNTDANVINNNHNNINNNKNNNNNNNNNNNYNFNTQHQQQQEFYKHQQQTTMETKNNQPLLEALNAGNSSSTNNSLNSPSSNSTVTTTTTTSNSNSHNNKINNNTASNNSTVEPMCMSPEHHPTPPSLTQQQYSSMDATSSHRASPATNTIMGHTDGTMLGVESNSSNSNSSSNSNNNNNNQNIEYNNKTNNEILNGCVGNFGASNSSSVHNTSTVLETTAENCLQKTSPHVTLDFDAMDEPHNNNAHTNAINHNSNNNNNNNNNIIHREQQTSTSTLNFFNETLDLSQEDIQRTLAANMPYDSEEAAQVVESRLPNLGFMHRGIKRDSENEIPVSGIHCTDGGDGDAEEDEDADDVFANLDAFDMLVEFPELDLDDKQALSGTALALAIDATSVDAASPLEQKTEISSETLQQDKKLLHTICDFSPEWSYPEGGVKVLVAGPWTANANYSILFDSQPVPTMLVQEGVLRCYCPAHEVGYATLQVSSDGNVISNAVMFEYKLSHCQQAAADATTNDCLYKYSLLNRLSTIDERLQLKAERNGDSLSSQCAVLLQSNFEEKLVSYCHELTKGTWNTHASGTTWEDYKGMTLLHLAAALGFSKLICAMLNWRTDNPNIILETELDALSQDFHGFTPMAWACARNHLETVSILYKWNHNALKIKNHAQQSPLDIAAAKGYRQLVNEVYRWEQERLQKHSGRSGSLGSLAMSLSAYSLSDIQTTDLLDVKQGSNSDHGDSYANFNPTLDSQKHDGVFLRPIAFASQSPPNNNRFSKRSSVDSGINMDIRTRTGKYFKDLARLHSNLDVHDQYTSFAGVESSLCALSGANNTASNAGACLSASSPLRKMDFALCEVSTGDTSPLPPDNENDDTSSTINNDDDITDINTETDAGGGVVGDSDAKVLTLAEHIIAAMPERIKNEADEMMVLGSPMTEPLNSESSGLNDGFMDPLLDSLPNTHFDSDFSFDFHEHSYRYHDVSTPCSSLSPASSGPLQSPASYSILGTDPSVSSPSPPPSTKQLTEFLHASSSSQYPFEADFSKLTLTDTEQRELYEAAICIQKAYRSYKGRQKLEEQNKERTAAIVIQNYYRRYKQFAYYRQMTNAALVIQHGYRSYCKNKRFKKSQTTLVSHAANSHGNGNNNDSQCLSSFYDHFKKDQQQLKQEFNSHSSSPKETSPSGPLKRTYSQSTQNQAARKIQQFMRQSRIKLQRERAEKEKLVHQRREEYLQNLLYHGQPMETTVCLPEKSEINSGHTMTNSNLNILYPQDQLR